MRYVLCLIAVISLAPAQTPHRPAPSSIDPAKVASLLETGRCPEGLPQVKRAYAATHDSDLKRKLGTGGVRCAMTLNDVNAAAQMIETLNRDFPKDPDILYLSVHTYSDLSLRASQTLLFTHPDAYQVHELNAEALETQGKWDEATEEYRVVLKKNPDLPGIHYRVGRALLSKPETPTTREEAKKEFRRRASSIDPEQCRR